MADTQISEWIPMPKGLSRQFQNLTSFDLFVIVALGLGTMVAYLYYDLVGVILAVLGSLVLLDQLEYVRVYDYVFIQLPSSLVKRARKGRFYKRGISKRSPLPYHLTELEDTSYAVTYLDKKEDRVSLTITSSGSPYMSLEIAGMRAFLDRLSRNYRSVTSQMDLAVSISSVVRLREWDPHQYRMFVDEAEQPRFILPSALLISPGAELTDDELYELDQFKHREEMIAEYQASGARDLVMATVINVRRKPGMGQRSPLYEDDELNQPIIDIARDVVAKHDAMGIADATILDIAGTQQFYHEAWNHNAEKLAAFRTALRSGTLDPGGHWPEDEIIGTKSYVSMDDGNIHGLIRIVGTPELVSPLFLQQVYSVPASSPTITQLTQSMAVRGELLYYGTLIDLADGLRDYVGQGRVRARASRKRDARLEREKFADEQPHRALFDTYIDIAAPDLQTWRREMKATLNYLEGCNIAAKHVVTLETILHEMVWRVLTGVV